MQRVSDHTQCQKQHRSASQADRQTGSSRQSLTQKCSRARTDEADEKDTNIMRSLRQHLPLHQKRAHHAGRCDYRKRNGGADRHSREGRLGDGRVADARGAVDVGESARDAEGAAVGGDVLAHDEDAGILREGLVEGVADDEVVILEIVKDGEGETLVPIDNEILLDEVFNEFMEIFEDMADGEDDE